MKKPDTVPAFLFALTLIFGLGNSAFSQEFGDLKQTISAASYFSSGDYGEDSDTDILYFPVSYSANYGKWGAQVTLAHLRVNGPGNVLVNIGGVNRAVAGMQRERTSGIGDSVVSVIYQFDPFIGNSLFMDLRLDVKLPTADESRGLGSGETDYSAQVELSKGFGSSVLFSAIGHTIRGKTDLYPGLQNSAFAQLGLAKTINSQWNIGLFYDYREAASSFSQEVHELVPYFSWQISTNCSFTGLAAVGFTNASASTAVLGQLSYSW